MEIYNRNDNDKISEQLQTLYTSSVAEIDSFKQQQWKVTNYALLTYAAILSIANLYKPFSNIEWFCLLLVSGLTCYLSCYTIKTLGISIQKRRSRLTEVHKRFSDEFMKAWDCKGTDGSPDRKPSLDWLFYSILGLGLITTIWLLVRIICFR